MSLLATLLVCSLLWCGVRTAIKPDIEALFVDTGLDDKTFSEHLVFDYPAEHALGCARQCLHHASCLAFTFDLGTCHGHSEVKTSASASTSATGAKCFAKVTAGVVDCAAEQVKCRHAGLQQLTVPSLGLNLQVYCEDDWMVILRRQDGSVDFYRSWDDYTNGFGSKDGEFWLGLEPLHLITSTQTYYLAVELGDWEGNFASATYTNFSVSSAADNFRLQIQYVGGTANDSLTWHSGMQFSTYDADNDDQPTEDCSSKLRGAWWYRTCAESNLCGEYKSSSSAPNKDGVGWKGWHGTRYSLRFVQMKIRPV